MPQAPEPLARTLDGPEICGTSLDPFATMSESLRWAGLAPIPVGGEDGKKPLVTSFSKWKRRPGQAAIRRWTDRFPEANLGVVTGPLSGVTVVDVDSADPMVQQQIIERFGDTPLKTRTPSDGLHLWYRHDGEASADLSPDLPVQVKGAGGIIVVPPSVRPSGAHAGRSYEFFEGSLVDLPKLPKLTPGSVDRFAVGATNPTRLRAAKEGRRNNSLFRHLIGNAPYCDDLDALLEVGMTFGLDDCDPSLPTAEIVKTVCSVWRMHEEGRLWAKGAEPQVVVSRMAIDALTGDALRFYLKLQLSHFDRPQFALAPKAMSQAQVIPGWSHHKYRAARDELLQKRYLKMVHEGGSGPGDPSLFVLSSPPASMGTESVPNITQHPPPRVLRWTPK